MNRKLYTRIYNYFSRDNVKKGLYPEDNIQFCQFELSHDLDRGGVPDDVQDITHPSVVCVHNEKGRKVWIAATPYPQENRYKGEPYENTCIFHADYDGEEPPTIFNSITRNPIIWKEGAKYNSDCDLFYDCLEHRFYALTRKRRAKDYLTRIVMQSSNDGHLWTEPITLFDTDRKSLCPCLVKTKDCKYLIYMFNPPGQYELCENFEIWESDSLATPAFHFCGFNKWCDPNISIWHGDVDLVGDTYYMVFCGVNLSYKKRIIGGQDKTKYLWLARSNDGIHWDHCQTPIIQASGAYRSSFFVEGNDMIIYVSFLNKYVDSKHPAGNKIGILTMPMSDVDSLF